jgi:hypothetical protein
MSIVTLEGIVEHGQIRLSGNVRLPDSTKVYVIVPGLEVEQVARLASPRLARPEQVSDVALQVRAEDPDGGI